MPTKKHHHRHLVILPLFAFVFAASLPQTWMAGSALGADVTDEEVALTPGEVLLSNGTAALVLDGSGITEKDGWPEFTDGSVLVGAQSIVRLAYGDIELIGWNGAFSASIEDGSLTVAAVTTPVLVRADGERHLVPAGMRWQPRVGMPGLSESASRWIEARSPSPIPSDVFKANIILSTSLHPVDLGRASGTSPSWMAAVPDALRFPSARVRGAEQRAAQRVVLLKDMIATAPADDAYGLIVSPETATVLTATEAGVRALPSLVSLSVGNDKFLSALLPSAAVDLDLWMLLSFHPSVQAFAWMQASPAESSAEDVLLRLFLLPASDLLPQQIHVAAYIRWSAALADVLEHADDPGILLRASLPLMESAVHMARAHGYVERAERMTDGYVAAAEHVREALPDDLWAAIHALHKVPAVKAVAASAVIETLSAEESALLKAKAAQLLSTAGMRETKTTAYAAFDGHTVRVTDVIVGVRVFSFTFDMKRDQLSNVFSQGTSYPLASPRAGFVAWAQTLK